MIATLLHLGLTAAPPSRATRLWLHPGVPVLVGPQHTLTLETVRAVEDDGREAVLRLRTPSAHFSTPVESRAVPSFLASGALCECLPRALVHDTEGRLLRALVEVQAHQVLAA